MQSIFRLPWCSDQLASQIVDKVALDKLRASPLVEMPGFGTRKRKCADSPEPPVSLQTQPSKKQRADGEVSQKLADSPARPLAATEPQQTSAHSQTVLPDNDSPTTGLDSLGAHVRAIDLASTPTAGRPTPLALSRPDQPRGRSGLIRSDDALTSNAAMTGLEAMPSLTPLQQVIDHELSVQILMKHNELRLIEQELAKCQVALEQLRRCAVRPYPGDVLPSAEVSAGTGASLAPSPGHSRPSHPAPYGVTEGPYTRHYRQWLLHDPVFDPIPLSPYTPSGTGPQTASRSTRHHASARKTVGKAPSLPGRLADTLQSLPNYPAPAPKDKLAPLVLRRSTDGQLVKLICNNCQRGNFSSIQGFLNHCRIAHKVDYKSHDAAAVDCGQPLSENETANLSVDTHNVRPPKSTHSRMSSAMSTPLKNLVHPMNAAGGAAPLSVDVSHESLGKARKPAPNLTTSGPPQRGQTAFKPSCQAPRLSAHFAKHKFGGDLEQAIAAARQKVELDLEDDPVSPDILTPDSPSVPLPGSRTVTGASHAALFATPGAEARPHSRKSFREPPPRHRPSPLGPPPTAIAGPHLDPSEIPESPQDHMSNLSPHTADSNPGLVSDHEDDDHASGSEDETPHDGIRHSLGVRRDCADNMDLDVTVEDGLDEHGVVIRRNSMVAADERMVRAAGSPSRPRGVGK